MKVLTPDQELLTEYLCAIGMPLVQRLCVICELWEPEATMEMLQYIAETEERDINKLNAVSNKIARKWNRGVSLLEPSEDD